MEIISENRSFGGVQGVYRHASAVCGCDMTFAVYTPGGAGPFPVFLWLSGLTCTHENAMTKAGAQAYAAASGLALVFPDTSPRGKDVADDQDYALGQGAGFYVDATQAPWVPHFRMWSYVSDELPTLLGQEFADLDLSRLGVSGHSMGGHGALTLAMRKPEMFGAVSAFAPICNPSAEGAWGSTQLRAYLGDDQDVRASHDATHLIKELGWKGDILVDQGGADQFLDLLRPEALAHSVAVRRQSAVLRIQPGYDHSYYFVSSFIGDHIAWHAERL